MYVKKENTAQYQTGAGAGPMGRASARGRGRPRGRARPRGKARPRAGGRGRSRCQWEVARDAVEALSLTAPAAAAAFKLPMEVLLLKSKHSSRPSSPAQPKSPCSGEMPQALMPGDLAGRGDKNLQIFSGLKNYSMILLDCCLCHFQLALSDKHSSTLRPLAQPQAPCTGHFHVVLFSVLFVLVQTQAPDVIGRQD